MESVPADNGRISAHQQKQRKIFGNALQGGLDIFQSRIKVQEPADCKCDEVHDQRIIVGIIVDELDIQQDQDNIK